MLGSSLKKHKDCSSFTRRRLKYGDSSARKLLLVVSEKMFRGDNDFRWTNLHC